MEQTEILEGNKIIAEFMGETNLTKVQNGKTYREDKIVKYDKAYNTIWGNIMPVVEKIEQTATTKMEHRRDEHSAVNWCWIWDDEDENPVAVGQSRSKIESVWIAVVEFIKYYNSLKP